MSYFNLIQGDSLNRLKDLESNSVDSIVTDPPYELGFMGKAWDKSGIAYNVELWKECLRVLKPGGHLLSFSGTRTYHRMTVAIEDAGFEIRDQIQWLYGSGFPKSTDISKQIDKKGGNPLAWIKFSEFYSKLIKESKYNHNDIDRYLNIKASSCYWARTDHRGGLPPKEHWDKIKKLLNITNEFDILYLEAEREVIGIKKSSLGGTVAAGERNQEIIEEHKNKVVDITKPSTPEAIKWQGWGTALKPANEPICVARKPF